jgi:glycosyltransferase involved in cell wall biosynthesis
MRAGVKRRTAVVSAVNLVNGGPLTVLRDCVDAACASLPENWDVVVFVNRHGLLKNERARMIPVAYPKRSWFLRMWFEWVELRKHAAEIKPDLWLSLHDISPNVGECRQAVYCHNATPFFDIRLGDAIFEPPLLLWRLLYQYVYRINIKKNFAVIVQQCWIRDKFRRWVTPKNQLVVARPVLLNNTQDGTDRPRAADDHLVSFLYPGLSRAFKNFEVLCEAAKVLEARDVKGFEVRLTISGTENRYARWLFRRYSGVSTVRFIGLQNREQMVEEYRAADAVLFPSRLETWGLPISEAKQYNKPLLVADLPYGHETVGSYANVEFFPPNDAATLADHMQAIIEARWQPAGAVVNEPDQPYAPNWVALWGQLTAGL